VYNPKKVMPQVEALLPLVFTSFFVNISFEQVQTYVQKKPCWYKAFIVGVAGFEPATSSSQTRRDNRATLHPEIISVRKSTVLFLHPKIIIRNNCFLIDENFIIVEIKLS
tara:strand:- start:39 stop:368 length:330 start_codon:yes stop_codon:yes gene_type:complete